MKNMMLLSGIGLALGLLSAPADAQRYGGPQGGYNQPQGGVLRCESGDNRRAYCAADVRGGVELVRNLSRTQCVRGRNWGEDRGGVWVDGGCRGEFRVGFAGGRPGYGPGNGNGNGQHLVGRPFRCESDNGRTRQCRVDERGGRATLVRQLSSSPCVAGRTWGQDQAGIWVSNGCRGEFVIEQRRGNNGNRWGNRR